MKPELHSTKRQTETALVVGVVTGDTTEAMVHEHLDELALLAETAGAEVVGRVTQKLSRINPSYFIGKGKAEQIVSQGEALGVSLIIFDEELSPAQTKNYQELSQACKVIDRSGLILDIFRKHARTKEAKTQVELAQLQYLLPRLTRMWTHLERQMGGIGTRAGAGETQIEVDRRILRTRIARLQSELVKIDKERETQSQGRKRFYRVSLVGYTNAGKSTLMRALSGANVYIQDRLFATLDTTIRQLKLDGDHTVLLSDTVGFIRKLPHHLVASFRSTLKEVTESDLLLIVLDAGSDQIIDHLATIQQVLQDLDAAEQEVLIVLNKIDTIDMDTRLPYLNQLFPEAISVSALNHLRIDKLIETIKMKMDSSYQTVELSLPYDSGKAMSLVQEGVAVIKREYSEEGVTLTIRGPELRIAQILSQIEYKKTRRG
ncbi:MAG: GTPase HflX [Fidelibacterota bacterium]